MLRKPINNAQACISWLSYLGSQGQAPAIVGPVTDEVLEVAGTYEAQNTMVTYFAEAQLLGEPGIDLSVEYYADNFMEGNPLVNAKTKAQGDVFCKYVGELVKLAPAATQSCCLYLEADTASGDATESSAFINCTGQLVPMLLPELLKNQGAEGSVEAVMKVLDKCEDTLLLWLVGFMKSREGTPTRLTLMGRNNDSSNLLKGLKQLFGDTLPKDLPEKLQKLMDLGIYRFMVDVEVLQDGSLGKTIGLEFTTYNMMPTEQAMLMREEPYKKSVQLLKQWGLADERLDCLPNCIWSGAAPDKVQEPYYMYSRLSHFKLRWQGEKLLPCKVYLQLKCEPILENLNRYFNI